MREMEVGRIDHWYGHLGVAGIHLMGPLKVGDHIRIVGRTTSFDAVVESMEIDHQSVMAADADTDVGVRVPERVRMHDRVYLVAEA